MFNPDAPTHGPRNWARPCKLRERDREKGESEELTGNRGRRGRGGKEGMNAAPVPSPMSQARPG